MVTARYVLKPTLDTIGVGGWRSLVVKSLSVIWILQPKFLNCVRPYVDL